MPIEFACPHCGKKTLVADQYAGTSGPCAGCGKTITIPAATPFRTDAQAVTNAPLPSSKSSVSWVVVIAVGAFCFCGGFGILVALLLPAVQSAREAARRMQCSNNMKQIMLALHNYHDVYKCFPPAYIADKDGKPMHSWRVLILPFIEQSPLYDQYDFDQPWDSPANLAVASRMPQTYRCPSAPDKGLGNETNYVVIIGDPQQFPQTMFTPNRPIKLREVIDGTSNTIAVVEVRDGVPWTQPDADLKFAQMQFTINAGPNSISSYHPSGANVGFADGSVRFMSSRDSQSLRSMIQPADNQ